MKNRTVLCLLLLSALSFSLHAQSFKGKVTDASTSEALPYANVVVIDGDTTVFNGAVTDADGQFSLTATGTRRRVRVSYIGFLTKDTLLTAGTSNLIPLTPDANLLGEVVVKADRKIHRLENGGISTDVANSPLKSIGSAGDVLEKLPFVVKSGTSIRVLGKGSPLIYINNRLVRNNNELEKLRSENIKKVTVITNPGAEYDATVSSVIRIEAVRPPGEGLSGDVWARGNQRHYLNADGAVDLNYRYNKLDLFGYYWLDRSQSRVNTTLNRHIVFPNLGNAQVSMLSTGWTTSRATQHYMQGGFNYEFSPKHSIGARYTYITDPNQKGEIGLPTKVVLSDNWDMAIMSSSQYPGPASHIEESESYTHTTDRGKSHSHYLNAYYTGAIAPWLQAQLDMDYYKGGSSRDQASVTEMISRGVVFESTVAPLPDERLTVSTSQNYDLYAAKLTLSSPVWNSELRYGGEYSHTNNDQGYFVHENQGAEGLVTNENNTKQQSMAAFASYSKSLGKGWGVNLGLRMEHVGFDYFEQGKRVDEQSRSYTDLFPTAMLSWQGSGVQMMLGYRATVNRPSYGQLRSALQYDDPYTYETGNPLLQPTRIDDLSYTFVWKKLQVMASYKMYRDRILGVMQRYNDTDIFLYKPENIPHSQGLTLGVNYGFTLGWWTPSFGVSMQKQFLEYGTTEVKQTYNKPIFGYNWYNSLRLPADFTFRLDLTGNSRGHTGQTYAYDNYRVDAQLNKRFLKGNLIFILRVVDLFDTSQNKGLNVNYPLTLEQDSDPHMQSVQFSLTYRFNSTRSKYRGSGAADSERSRL
ncbi:MAG: TonB-dependent receptor [Prevotellaceae bacterium]|jgi:hypothetical protein|nr:TonB-dependent receptor [Prevotellaceae bacterium]